jgi:hypothetical protein
VCAGEYVRLEKFDYGVCNICFEPLEKGETLNELIALPGCSGVTADVAQFGTARIPDRIT